MKRARWAVFLSGKGSTAQALWDLVGEIDCVLCLSNKPDALGLKKAKKMGIPTMLTPMKDAKSIDWTALHQELKRRQISHIFLLGFMKLVPHEFLKLWDGQIFNLHPSLLPDFPGMHAIEKSFEAGKDMGVTVHHVNEHMDAGQIVLQRKVLKKVGSTSIEKARSLISTAELNTVRRVALAKNSRAKGIV